MIQFTTHQAAETLELGEWIGRRLTPGTAVGLDGELGAGKTWMAKGLVRGIGDYDETSVKSPAYNLVHEYPVVRGDAVQPVIHVDFYRLDELTDTDFLLFSEIVDRPEAIVLVEWARKFLAELIPDYLSVTLTPCPGGDAECRQISIGVTGSGYIDLLAELEAHAHADS